MRRSLQLAALVLLTSSFAAAQQPSATSSPLTKHIRLGAVWAGTSGDADVDGGHGSLETNLTSVDGLGADVSIEMLWSDLGLQLGATWLALDYEEDYRIFSGTGFWYGHSEDTEQALHLYGSLLVRRPCWGRHQVLFGPIVGINSGGDELMGSGLTYGAQAMLELQSGRDNLWYTFGARLTNLPLGGEYEDERISLIQANIGARFDWP